MREEVYDPHAGENIIKSIRDYEKEIANEIERCDIETQRLAQIGRDYQYLSTHEEVCGLPTVEDMQKLANKRRAQEGIE